MYNHLDRINSPSDLKSLTVAEAEELCSEIREFLVSKVEKSGGHLASNLGVTELTVAIHRVFDSPHDRIIFDVGHQAYVHKIITGRRDMFGSLRATGGLSGFTSRRESEHDPFGAGHSSTSLSAALGFAEATSLDGDRRHTVCVIGDGAYTGGMVHEALNNCKPDLPLVIILNENGMSISANRGTFAGYLSKVRVSKQYRRFKRGTANMLHKIPVIGKPIRKVLLFCKDKLKKLLYKENYFEQLGLYYIGTVDGHDLEKCEQALREARDLGKTVVVHVKTRKGCGYEPAEKAPDSYHSVSGKSGGDTFHSVFADHLSTLAQYNHDVVAVTAAMGMGTGLEEFGNAHPKKYFDVGIAEEHALTFAAGLAAAGKIPFVGIYSTFLQRGYDNLIHDIALQNLPVKLMIDRAGLAVRDGATHHGIFDVAFLSHIPNMSIIAPINYQSLKDSVTFAAEIDSPVAIRYPNTHESLASYELLRHIGNGVSVSFADDEEIDVLYVAYGRIYERALEASVMLSGDGVRSGVAVLEILKPLEDPTDTLIPLMLRARRVVFVEEGIRRGGVGEAIAAILCDRGIRISYKIAAIDDNFASPESPCDLYEHVGLDSKSLVRIGLGVSE